VHGYWITPNRCIGVAKSARSNIIPQILGNKVRDKTTIKSTKANLNVKQAPDMVILPTGRPLPSSRPSQELSCSMKTSEWEISRTG
jgi:hypothetical protein